MEFKNLKDHVKCLNTVVEFVKNNASHYACVFSGSKAKSFHLLSELERKLTAALPNVEVIHIHEGLRPPQKYVPIRIFCLKLTLAELSAPILLATSTTNVGIDNNLVLFILSLG